jgi:hypothetical protein
VERFCRYHVRFSVTGVFDGPNKGKQAKVSYKLRSGCGVCVHLQHAADYGEYSLKDFNFKRYFRKAFQGAKSRKAFLLAIGKGKVNAKKTKEAMV